MNNRQRFAVLGLVLVLPAFLAVASGLLQFSVPGALISPVLVLPGLVGAFLVSAIGILRVGRERELSGGLAAITIRIEARLLNLAVAALSLLLTAILAGYLFVENFHPH
jgi:hypothetical protein